VAGCRASAPPLAAWLKLLQFRETVFFEVGPDQLIEGMLTAMAAEPAGSPRELFFYEAALLLSYHATHSRGAFARLYEMADNRADLAAVLTRSVSSDVPEGRYCRKSHRRGNVKLEIETNESE
jgi:hypothetical protein